MRRPTDCQTVPFWTLSRATNALVCLLARNSSIICCSANLVKTIRMAKSGILFQVASKRHSHITTSATASQSSSLSWRLHWSFNYCKWASWACMSAVKTKTIIMAHMFGDTHSDLPSISWSCFASPQHMSSLLPQGNVFPIILRSMLSRAAKYCAEIIPISSNPKTSLRFSNNFLIRSRSVRLRQSQVMLWEDVTMLGNFQQEYQVKMIAS